MSVVREVSEEYEKDDITRPVCHRLVLYTDWGLIDFEPYCAVIDCATSAFHRQVRRVRHER